MFGCMVAQRSRDIPEWVICMRSTGNMKLPYYGLVDWEHADLESMAFDWEQQHRPLGSGVRWQWAPPFLVPNEFRPCSGCPGSYQHRYCQYAAWAQLFRAWQKSTGV